MASKTVTGIAGQAGRLASSAWLLLPILVATICAVALALRLGAIAVIGPPQNMTDYSESGIIARNLASGQGYVFDFWGLRPDSPLRSFMPPLFVWFVFLCLRLSPQPPLALAVAQAFLSALTCVAVYWIALQLSRRRVVAVLATLGVAVYPVPVLMVTVPHSLTLHLAILAWALALTIRLSDRPAWWLGLVTGGFWGVLGLGRPSTLGFLPLVVLWLWWNRKTTRGWAQSSAFLVSAGALVVLPWTVRNYQVHGALVPISTHGGFTFWNGNNPFTTGCGHDVYTEKLDRYLGQAHDPAKPVVQEVRPYPLPPEVQTRITTIGEVELDTELLRAGLTFVREHHQDALMLSVQKLMSFWWFRPNLGDRYQQSWTRYYKPLYVALLVLFVAGLVVSAKQWRRYSLLYLLFAHYTVTFVTFEVLTRYRWEIEPFFFIFASLAAVTGAEAYQASRPARRPTAEVTSDQTAIRQ